MLIGSLAIAGIPPLAGFFSKDEILGESFKLGFWWVWAIGFIVAGLTAFYMFRLMGMTFWGVVPRPEGDLGQDPRVAPVMTIPLILLAIPSVFLGMYLGLPLGASRIQRLAGAGLRGGRGDPPRRRPGEPAYDAVRHRRRADPRQRHDRVDRAWSSPGGCSASSIGPIRLPARPERVRELTARAPFLYRASLNKWWFDDLNHLLFMVIGGRIAAAMLVVRPRGRRRHGQRASGAATIDAGRGLRQVQTGRVQNYALGIAIGLIVMAGSYLLLAGG